MTYRQAAVYIDELNGKHRKQKPNGECPGISHEYRGRLPVEEQKRHKGSGEAQGNKSRILIIGYDKPDTEE